MEKTAASQTSGIAYQNKDITAKYLGEHLVHKSFGIYGAKLPRIVRALPTNLPIIEANELRIDNLFLLEDGSLALVDYESIYADEDKIKYLHYIVRTLKRYMKERNLPRRIRMIVIYTADVEPYQTRPRLDIGCLQFELEEIFLSSLDSEGIEEKLQKKVGQGEALTEEEQMQFILLPLTFKGIEEKRSCIDRCFRMAKQVKDENVQVFMLSGMVVFTDKIIETEVSERVKVWIMMTKVGRLFEEEKLEYGRQEAERVRREDEIEMKKAEKRKEERIVNRLLAMGDPIEKIMQLVETVTREEVEEAARIIRKN